MGAGLGMILAPFFFATLVGVFLKLILDAFSDAFYKRPFKYMGWPLTILIVIILTFVTYLYAENLWDITDPKKLTQFQSLFLSVMRWSTIIGIFILPFLAIYGIIKDVIRTANKKD